MKTSKFKYLFLVAALGLSFTSCDDFFEPAKENNLGLDYMDKNASYAEGVLGNAYTRIPCGSFPFSEVGTDDAVSNDATNNWRWPEAHGHPTIILPSVGATAVRPSLISTSS